MRRGIVAVLLTAGLLAVPGQASAEEPPTDCLSTEAYYLAVIGNFQAEVDRLTGDVAYWQAAHDAVAAAAVQRNVEYAAEVDANRRLRDRIRMLRSVIRALRQ